MGINRAIRRAVAAVLLCGCLLLAGCGRLHGVSYDREMNLYTDGKTGIVYTDAPGCYEPVRIGDSFGKWHVKKGANIIFHEIGDMDSAQWLCEEGKTVFYAQGVTLPTLREMTPSTVYLCVEESLTMALVTITSPEEIGALIDTWENAQALSYSGLTPSLNLRVKFWSEKYPGLYFNLIYLEYSDGSRVLYDRSSGRCVDAGDILAKYVDVLPEDSGESGVV